MKKLILLATFLTSTLAWGAGPEEVWVGEWNCVSTVYETEKKLVVEEKMEGEEIYTEWVLDGIILDYFDIGITDSDTQIYVWPMDKDTKEDLDELLCDKVTANRK